MPISEEEKIRRRRECTRLWRLKSKEHMKAYTQKYYAENREARLEAARKWRKENPEKRLEQKRKRYAEKKEVVLAENRRWYLNNPAKMENYERNKKISRRARAKLPIPAAEQAEIDGMYFFCKLFPKFEVDHIIPLRGKNVSGLHVLGNLQVIERSANRRKSNKFEVTV